MDKGILFPLVQNAALLLALVFLYDVMPKKHQRQYFLLWRIIIGALIGGIGITLMSTPWIYQPGIFFDTRSVLLCISGLFFGGLATFVAVIMTALYRISIGGSGMWIGIGVIMSSAIIGVIWRQYRQSHLANISGRETFLFAFIIHIVMLMWFLFLPNGIAIPLLRQVTLPVLTIFPITTWLLIRLLSRRIELERDEQIRLQDDFLFRSQFNVGNIGIAITGVEQQWIKVNPRLCQMFKYSEAQLLRMTWAQITHPDDLEADALKFALMLRGEIDNYEMDKRFIDKDDSVVYTHMTVACKRGNNNAVQLVIAGFLDITSQALADQEVLASREQLELVLSSSDLGVWDWDIRHDRIERNARSADILGCDLDMLNANSRQWIDAIVAEDRPKVLHSIEAHIRGETAQHKMEYRLNTLNRKVRWILDTGKVVSRDAHDNALRMCGTYTDITDAKLIEESLKLSALVYENSSEAMSVLDEKGVIITVNAAFSVMTGYREFDVRDKHIQLLYCDLNSRDFYIAMNQEIRKKGQWQGEMWLRRKNG
ncbi:MAG: PAS domain S-box protein, partial [Shewanella sp.]